jgi:hypothetical protein
LVSIRWAVRANEERVEVLDLPLRLLDLPLVLLGLPLVVIHASIEGFDGRKDSAEGRFFIAWRHRSDVFIPGWAIQLVIVAGWI